MSKLKKVLPVQSLKISAAAYNLFVDAANDYLQRRLRLGGGASGFQRPAGIISVKNNSGSDQLRFAVLGLDEPIYSPTDNEEEFKNNPSMKAVAPSMAHVGRFVVLQEPLAISAIGRGMVTGVTPMRIEWIAPSLVGSELWSDGNWALVALKGSGGAAMRDKYTGYVVVDSGAWYSGIAISNKISQAVTVRFVLRDSVGAGFTYDMARPAYTTWSFNLDAMLSAWGWSPTSGNGILSVSIVSTGHAIDDIAVYYFMSDGLMGASSAYLLP